MEYIKLTEIENLQNYFLTKGGELCTGNHILMRIKNKIRGKFPIFYYQGKQVIINVGKEDIEEVIYCEQCGYQELDSESYKDNECCPRCNSTHAYGWEGYRIKGRKHHIYDDKILENMSQYVHKYNFSNQI